MLQTLEGHHSTVTGVVVLPDGQRALSGSTDWTLKLWDLTTGAVLQTLERHRGVTAVAVLPDGQRALSASRDRTLRLWDLTVFCSLGDGPPAGAISRLGVKTPITNELLSDGPGGSTCNERRRPVGVPVQGRERAFHSSSPGSQSDGERRAKHRYSTVAARPLVQPTRT